MTSATPFVLPDVARDKFVAVVGRDNALVTDDERDEYRDPYWPQDDRTYDSSLVLFPTSTEQVQEIVRIANQHEVPVWASSQGRNNGYGGPSPRVRGSVLISFRKMNRVLEVNTELAYAVVEPGVRWFDLYDVLHAQGDELLVSVPDVGWGSVIGNSLDNGQTFLPNGSDFNALNGLEVVLADGSLLRTGLGAQEGNPAWHLYKRGLGPALDPLFTQSNYGIVTKAGVWLQRRPKAYAPMYLSIPRYGQLAPAIDAIRELRLAGILRGMPYVMDLLTLGDVHFPEHKGKIPSLAAGTLSEEELDAAAGETGIGRWGVRTALWGDPEVLDVHERLIREAWSAVDGGQVRRLGTYTAENWHELAEAGLNERICGGIPVWDAIEAIPDFVGHCGCSPVVPLRGNEVAKVVQHIKDKVTSTTGMNFLAQIFVTNERSAVVVGALLFDRTNPEHVQGTIAMAKELLAELGGLGYSEYRAHIDFMDLAQEQLAFGGHAYRRFAETVKDAIDPNGILSPGRYGIWPARYRS